MAYVINRYNGQELLVLEDGTIDTTYSLGLVGRNYVGYGETQNENFVYLLENFANAQPPKRPLEGQLWFDSANNLLYVYDATKWTLVGAATISEQTPQNPSPGALWFETSQDTLSVFNGTEWKKIGPEVAPGFGVTRARSRVLLDTNNVKNAVIELVIDNAVIAIVSGREFTISPQNPVPGFDKINNGVNVNNQVAFHGSLSGNADTATKLQTRRNINGVPFDGTSNITITASTTGSLIKGDYILGDNFNGTGNTTWSVDATPDAIIGKVVARDSAGNFRANQITASLVGNVIGNVQIDTGFSTFNEVRAQRFIGATLVGKADSADKLATARLINGVSFDGSRDITISASATSLTGAFLAPNVLSSSLEQVGTLLNLSVKSNGIIIGDGNDIKIGFQGPNPLIKSQISGKSINIEITDNDYVNPVPRIRFLSSTLSLDSGGQAIPTLTKEGIGEINLGMPLRRWNKFYANETHSTSIYANSITPETGATTTMSGNLVITGDLSVQGAVTTINTTEIVVEDKTLTIAGGSTTAAEADGAGITVDGAGATFLYAVSGNKWTMNRPLDMGSNNITTTGLFQGTATSAQYADLAENYVADKNYEPGTVVELGGEFEITEAESESRKIAGVVSTYPAYLMNSQCEGEFVLPIALQGRAPCKVSGKIKKGDMLVSSGQGRAKSCDNPKLGSVIGKALEDFDGDQGVIEVLVGRL